MYYECINGREYAVGESELTRKERIAKAFEPYDEKTATWISDRMKEEDSYGYDELVIAMESGDIDEVLYMYGISEKDFLNDRERVWEELLAKREERTKKAKEALRKKEEKANKALRRNKGGKGDNVRPE